MSSHGAGAAVATRGAGALLATFVALAILHAPDAQAQSSASTRVAVTLDAHDYAGNPIPSSTWTCTGTPTCTYKFSTPTDCGAGSSGTYTMTGLNLAQSGTIQGSISQKISADTLFEGACERADIDFTYPFSGTWNAGTQSGTLSISGWSFSSATRFGVVDGCSLVANACPPFTGSLKLETVATPTPVFQMAVRSTITPTSATATADIQFRPQDVGTTASVFTFAVAPRSLVKAAAKGEEPQVVGKALSLSDDKDTPADCVLAQVSSSGQLIAVTTAQLQAFSSGTLSAQGASVSILNNASTPAVAGATFYVGYGASSTAMITNGIYRNAVTVPGASVCPMLSSQTALWWNPAENGWGVNFAHQGNILFGTLYTYDAAGAPLWLLMSNGAMQADGVTFSGDLYRTTGPAFNANPFTPITPANLTKVGTMTASFVDANAGTLSYTVNGAQVNKTIQRLVYGSRAASCLPSTASRASSTNYQDLWWNAAESGWGVNVTHQDNTLFATLFNYDATGKGLWLVMSGGVRQADGSYQGTLYRSSGPAFNASPFTPITEANLTNVGTMRFQFADGERGTLSYTVNGAPVTKAITRLVFSSPVPTCN